MREFPGTREDFGTGIHQEEREGVQDESWRGEEAESAGIPVFQTQRARNRGDVFRGKGD